MNIPNFALAAEPADQPVPIALLVNDATKTDLDNSIKPVF